MPNNTGSGPPAAADRLAVLDAGRARVADLSQWTPGLNAGEAATFSNSAYLIQHGDRWLMWDAGLADEMVHVPGGRVMAHGVRGVVTRTLASQFDALGVRPADVTDLAFSHAHFDHVGNSRYFRNARWYVQEAEYRAMFGPDYAAYGFIPSLYATLRDNLVVIAGAAPDGEYDVFGDGSVRLVATPGHTPGHQSLLVRLPKTGPVVLGGDVAHFADNFRHRRVPAFNADADQSRRSMDRIDALARAEGARLWFNHDAAQTAAIPRAPAWIE